MTNNELFYFLGKCLSMGDNGEKDQELIRAIREEKVDWGNFVEKASNHLVLPSVYLRFKRLGILSDLPEELGSHLQMVYELNYRRNTAILEQTGRINLLLSTAGIVPIYLKGAANLLDNLYEDVGERMIGDIDLLVSDTEFLQAANLLKSEGYEHAHPFFEDQQAATKHFPRLVHPTELADVEVHRVPVALPLSAHFNYASVRPEIKPIKTDPPCYVLSDRHKVVLNFMHGFMAKDVLQRMRMVSFRNMVDLFFLSRRVDVYDVLAQQTQYASKALVYADFTNRTMGFAPSHQPNLRSRLFIQKHDLLLKSRFWYRLIWLAAYLFSRIWSGYIYNAAGMFFSKRIRRSVLRRLGDPGWYVSHLKSYTYSFKQNLGR